MKKSIASRLLLLAALLAPCASVCAQEQEAPPKPNVETRAALAVIDDATFYGGMRFHLPSVLNQVLVEPTLSARGGDRWQASASLIGVAATFDHTATQLRVKESYAGLSAGDFDFTVGRKMVRWGTGYAFTAAGVLDPPRIPTNPTDRLNLNQGRDMVKADWVRGQHALTAVWSSAVLAPAGSGLRDTATMRYNVLVHGFDTALIAGKDRGSDSFGALTFTRVVGQAWEAHGEAAWRGQGALLAGVKYTTAHGISAIGEFYTPPNTAWFRGAGVSPSAGRQHYLFLDIGKTRLRELPGWKQWDVGAYSVINLDDQSATLAVDVNRWFGNHFSTYLHMEIPRGARTSEYGAAPYSTATSIGVRFHL
ncbi:MAG: hypothetical protein WCE75_02300 [Terracidiphilus sp.]